MTKFLSTAATLCFLVVLIVIFRTWGDSSVHAISIPVSSGPQGECYDELADDVNADLAEIARREDNEVDGINDDREQTLQILDDYLFNPITTNRLPTWVKIILDMWGEDHVYRIVNAHYDRKVGQARNRHNASRLSVANNARPQLRFCSTLPTTYPVEHGAEEDHTQIFNQEFNWDAYEGMQGCGVRSNSDNGGKKQGGSDDEESNSGDDASTTKTNQLRC